MSFLEKIRDIFTAKKGTEASSENAPAKVLIVDDCRENRLFLDVLLKKSNFDCTLCESGEEAIQKCESEDFDIILMDIYMNGIDGIETSRILKSQEKTCHVPIIAVTAADSEEEKQKRIEVGINDYVAKPVDANNLLRRMNRQIKRAHQVEIAESGGDIYSLLSSDPIYKKAIKLFVKSLPGKIKDMQNLCNDANLTELARRAHSIKGTGGMAGFDVYTEKAAKLEKDVKSETPDLEDIKKQIDELADMVRRTKKTCQTK